MTVHILFFLVDMLLWLTAGAFIAVKYYPDQRVKHIWKKRGFILRALTGAMAGGMYAMLEKGLTHPLMLLYHLSIAILLAVIFLSITSPVFYTRTLRQVQTALQQIHMGREHASLIIMETLLKKSVLLRQYIAHAK
jgi:hypothetical protein